MSALLQQLYMSANIRLEEIKIKKTQQIDLLVDNAFVQTAPHFSRLTHRTNTFKEVPNIEVAFAQKALYVSKYLPRTNKFKEAPS